jgi:hypothetical protein
MKFLKTQNISKYSAQDETFIVHRPSGRAVIKSTDSLKLPIGAKLQRPIRPTESMIRYTTDDTSTHEMTDVANHYPTQAIGLEIYHEGQWFPLRLKEPAKIQKKFLGNGNWDAILQPNEDISKWFPISGEPLDIVVGLEQGFDPQDYIDSMLVLVENVFQISGTNFTLEESDGIVVGVEVVTGGTGLTPNSTTIPVTFSSPDVTGTTATGLGTTDGTGTLTEITITDPGAGYTGATTPTVTVTGETGPSSYTVKLAKPGWHIKFLSAVPDTKPVHVYYGFEQ